MLAQGGRSLCSPRRAGSADSNPLRSSFFSTIRDGWRVVDTVARVAWSRATGKPAFLIHRSAGIGDIVCTEPAVRTFRSEQPTAFIVYATRTEFMPIVAMANCADLIIPSDVRGAAWMMADRLYAARHDLLLADERTVPQASNKHLVDQFADQLGVIPSQRQPRLPAASQCAPWAQQATESVRQKGRPLIAIHVGPSWPVREWPQASWGKLVDALQSELDAVVVQLGADANTGTGPSLAPRIHSCIDWVGRWSLTETVAVLASVDILIGIDSGLLHLAGAVGTPSVGLFGAVDGSLRLPPDTPCRAVTGDAECLGCHHRLPPTHWRTGCPHDIACMKTLDYRDVAAATKQLLPATFGIVKHKATPA